MSRVSITTKVLLSLFVPLVLFGCQAGAPTPEAQVVSTATPVKMSTPIPIATQTPTEVPTATAAPTETAAPSPTPTADAALASVKLMGASWFDNYDLLITVQFPEAVQGDYHFFLEKREFDCEIQPQYPDRLYCKGRGIYPGRTALVRIFSGDQTEPGFEQDFSIPPLP